MTWVQWLCRGLLLALILLVVVTLPRLSFDNNILALFPEDGQAPGQTLAEQWRTQQVEGRLILLFGADDIELARESAVEAARTLAESEWFQSASARPDLDTSDIDAFYREHAPLLLTERHRAQLQAGQGTVLAETALRRLFTDPGSGLAERLQYDPLGTLSAFRQQRQQALRISIDNLGYPYVQEGESQRRFYLVNAVLAGSPYRLDVQAGAGEVLDSLAMQVSASTGVELLYTGSLFYTRSGSEQARGEISTVGLGSAIGIVMLLLLVFRSPTLLLLAFLPIATGVMVGLSVTWWVFGSVHVMALVFGASLVGVAIDYSLHFFAKRLWAGERWQSAAGIRSLFPPLALGLLTSSAAYLSFLTAGFPGFSQIAVFSATGLFSAFLVVVGVYPWLLAPPPASGLSPAVAAGLQRFIRFHHTHVLWVRHPLAMVLIAALLITALASWRSNDDIRQMQLPDADLTLMDQRVRNSTGAATELAYMLVTAEQPEQLLQQLEVLQVSLDDAVTRGQIGGYQSISQWLPSQQRQQENAVLWQQALIDNGVLGKLFADIGLADGALSHLMTPQSLAPLDLRQLSPLLVQMPQAPGYFYDDNAYYALVSFSAIRDAGVLAQLAERNPAWSWVDPVTRTSELLGHYRYISTVLLVLAYAVVLLVLSTRYGFRGASHVVTPPLLASTLALAVIVLSGQAISVFHMMALLLVLGIGIDYSLFLREGKSGAPDTVLAIALSTLTTVLSFGLLSLSATAAIHNFGLTVLLGICLAFLLAPLAQSGDALPAEDSH